MFSLRKKKEPPPFVSAVIVAAGAASRMAGIDKQQALLGDLPVVVRSIGQFEDCPMISEIVVVCREEQIAEYYRLVQEYGLEKVSSVVKGGDQRQQSVFAGVCACSEQAGFYAIHDGARPLISQPEIERCILTAVRCGAAAVGTPVKDTIKVCSREGVIQSTPARDALVAIQTPQVFAAGLYREAMRRAEAAGRFYTDDCQLVEQGGHAVAVSPGSYENIKITTPEDLFVANAILAYREQGAEG